MICSVCGSEFDIENFDVCPYCLTPVNLVCEPVEENCREEEDAAVVEGIPAISAVERMETTSTELSDFFDEEYEVTAEDLIDDDVEEEPEILIDELGLSVRAVNAFRRANIHTLNGLIEFLASNSISDLKNVGAKTVKETEDLLEKLRTGGLEIRREKHEKEEIVEGPIFGNISADVDFLSIDALIELGLSKKLVAQFLNNNIKCCEGLRELSRSELGIIVGPKYLDRLPAVATLLEQDIITLLNDVLDKYRDSREYNVFLRRAQGETLQEIAVNPNKADDVITRERVRQIERKYLKSILPFVRELLFILKGSNNYIGVQDILDIFDDDEYDQILLHAAKSCEEFEYLDFADSFVDKNSDYSIEVKLLELMKDIATDGIDLAESQETIEEILVENKLDFLDIDSICNLLKKYNYTIYGTFAVKGKANYATLCMHIVRKMFPDGIKLSQSESEQSDDLIRLRKIIEERYPGLSVPSSDRALSSTLVRSGLILRGRGMYIPQEYITIDEGLFSEIKNYIDAKETNKVFYNEIYSDFEGALNFMCGIDNYNYLHGVLAMRYPDSYEYSRDYLLKNGVSDSNADSIADRIYAYVCNVGRPVSKNELVQEFRGFSNVMLIMPFVNDSRLLQWEYNYYACTGILEITDQDRINLKSCITALFNENNGYASDGVLFSMVAQEYSEFILKNKIQSEMNLHYIVAKLFENEMDFRRPHIAQKGKLDVSSTKNVALYLLNNPDHFVYQQYSDLCDKMKWSRVTASAVLSDIEEDYARVSSEGYVKKTMFLVPETTINRVRELINAKLEDDILSLLNIDLDEFPDMDYSWNEFILETIVNKYFDEFTVVQPSMKDRRYQKGIIVTKDSKISTYSEIVARKMIITGNEKMTESQFLSFLVVHNLARKAIPNELANSDFIKKDGDSYCVINNQ